MMTWIKRVGLVLLGTGVILGGMVLDVQLRYLQKLESLSTVQTAPIAIVLGAGIQGNGQPSDALRDRLLVAQQLYTEKIVPKILVTGDDGEYRRNETVVMKNFLVSQGIPAEDILEDGHGYRTYESCKRAIQTFGITRAIVITQRFHIGRALYLCNRLGMDAQGVPSDLTLYRRILFFTARDMAASVAAWWDINVKAPVSPVTY